MASFVFYGFIIIHGSKPRGSDLCASAPSPPHPLPPLSFSSPLSISVSLSRFIRAINHLPFSPFSRVHVWIPLILYTNRVHWAMRDLHYSQTDSGIGRTCIVFLFDACAVSTVSAVTSGGFERWFRGGFERWFRGGFEQWFRGGFELQGR
jgi:hypothetical protein